MTHTTIPDNELFAFCARNANPELWRTTVPLVVRVRCNNHKGLIATWMAIHWLIVFWSATHRCAFGVREIAQEAGVGRNKLTGPNGHIQRLVDLGLIYIVGYQPVPGMPYPRPIYAIDHWDLEEKSMHLVPDMLRERGLPPPPRPATDPRQISFFDQLETGTGIPQQSTQADMIQDSQSSSVPTPVPTMPVSDMTQHPTSAHCPILGTASSLSGQHCPESVPDMPETGTAMPGNVPDMPASGTVTLETKTDLAHFRDMERSKDRKRDREREYVTHSDLTLLVDQVTRQVTEQIQAVLLPDRGAVHNQIDRPPLPIPDAPPDQPRLPANPLTLWQADRSGMNQRDHFQLDLLAGQYDAVTGGYGAYWVGRAIMMADLCLESKERRATIVYLKGILRRWHTENAWGSDVETAPIIQLSLSETGTVSPVIAPAMPAMPETGTALSGDGTPNGTVPYTTGTAAPITGVQSSTQAADPPATMLATTVHPAVACYRKLTNRTLRPHQIATISKSITNVIIWERTLRDWLDNGWNDRNIAGLLDRYFAQTGQKSPDQVSDTAIMIAPIDGSEKGRWLGRFRAAQGNAAKRAILEEFEAKCATLLKGDMDEGNDRTPGAS